MRKLIFFILNTICFAGIIYNKIEINYENIKLPHNEKMGLLSTNFLIKLNKKFYSGIGIYSAVSGKRGGFFTIGVDNSFLVNFGKVNWINGMFVGAGGGGAAPQGGGLMLRPYSKIEIKSKINYQFGVSKIKYPNGNINSTQFFLGLSYKFKNFVLLNNNETIPFLKPINVYINFINNIYLPNKGVKTTTSQKQNKFMTNGIEVGKYNKNFIYFLELAGATYGFSDGYMEYFAGIGYETKFLFSKFEIGAGGGGKVKTGGGILYKGLIGFKIPISNRLFIDNGIGICNSFSGFKSKIIYMALNYNSNILIPANKFYKIKIKKEHFRIDIGNKTYISSSTIRKTKNKKPLSLFSFKVDYFLNKNLYLTGESSFAHSGDSGGYAEGLIGMGYKIGKKIFIQPEILIGAGGGGGVNTNGGGIYNCLTYIGFTKKNVEVKIGGGIVKSLKQGINTKIFQILIGYNFNLLSGY